VGARRPCAREGFGSSAPCRRSGVEGRAHPSRYRAGGASRARWPWLEGRREEAIASWDRSIVAADALGARHFVTSGELDRELWYDGDRRLVRMALTGPDGSRVDYVLR
jgi:hypothetical protein